MAAITKTKGGSNNNETKISHPRLRITVPANPKFKKRRRGPIVQRTHSPKQTPSSPIQFLYMTIFSERSPEKRMKKSSQKIAQTSSKRKRGMHEENDTMVVKPSSLQEGYKIRIRILPPTVSGVEESVKVLLGKNGGGDLGGLLSFPTETEYVLGCRLANISSWKELLRLKEKKDAEERVPSKSKSFCGNGAQPLLYIRSASHARQFLSFQTRKTYVMKKKTPTATNPKKEKNTNESMAKMNAVTFSQGRIVFDRLALAFWPGPVVIYARANYTESPNNANIKSSTLDGTEEGANSDTRLKPVLLKRLKQQKDKTREVKAGFQGSTSFDYFIGLRCSSHPVTRKILQDLSRKVKKNSSGSTNGQAPLDDCVVAFSDVNITPDCYPSVSLTSKSTVGPNTNGIFFPNLNHDTRRTSSLRTILQDLPRQITHASNHNSLKCSSTVHVLNGEDKREIFTVPTCEYTSMPSLFIDEQQQIVYTISGTFRNDAEIRPLKRQKQAPPRYSLSQQAVWDAILKTESNDLQCDAIVNAVLCRWKVVEVKSIPGHWDAFKTFG